MSTFGKELLPRITICSHCFVSVISNFGFENRILILIVHVHSHCLLLFLSVSVLLIFKKQISSISELLCNNSLFGGQL